MTAAPPYVLKRVVYTTDREGESATAAIRVGGVRHSTRSACVCGKEQTA